MFSAVAVNKVCSLIFKSGRAAFFFFFSSTYNKEFGGFILNIYIVFMFRKSL
jgi:hypothetical protein